MTQSGPSVALRRTTHTHTDLGYSSLCALKHRGGDHKSMMPSDPKEPTVSLSVCVFEREKDF